VIAYFCIATILAQGVMIGYLWSSGRVDARRFAKAAAVLQGLNIDASTLATSSTDDDATVRTVSLSDIDESRATRLRQLELREQSLLNGLKQIRFERDKLTEERDRFERVYEKFKEQLAKDKVDALAKGNENARLLLESIKPKQAKELIMKMLEAEEIEQVVTMFGAMPIAKRAKIAAEFKTEEEAQKLDEIVRRIRQGLPEAAIIEDAQRQLQQPAATP
jgi:HD superfamily phosphohydrolase